MFLGECFRRSCGCPDENGEWPVSWCGEFDSNGILNAKTALTGDNCEISADACSFCRGIYCEVSRQPGNKFQIST